MNNKYIVWKDNINGPLSIRNFNLTSYFSQKQYFFMLLLQS